MKLVPIALGPAKSSDTVSHDDERHFCDRAHFSFFFCHKTPRHLMSGPSTYSPSKQ